MIASLLFFLFLQAPVDQPSLQKVREAIVSSSPEDLPLLFDKLAESDEISEKDVEVLLSFLGDQRPVIKTPLISDNVRVSRFASEALVEVGELAVPKLIAVLKESKEIDIRIIALSTLSKISKPSDLAQRTVESLISTSHDNPYLLESAIYALGPSSPDIERAIETLVQVPNNSSFIIRIAVARTLGDIGLGSPESRKKLLELTKDKNNWVQRNAVESLARVASKNDLDVVARLRELHNSTSQFKLRSAAFDAIKQIEVRADKAKVPESENETDGLGPKNSGKTKEFN